MASGYRGGQHGLSEVGLQCAAGSDPCNPEASLCKLKQPSSPNRPFNKPAQQQVGDSGFQQGKEKKNWGNPITQGLYGSKTKQGRIPWHLPSYAHLRWTDLPVSRCLCAIYRASGMAC